MKSTAWDDVISKEEKTVYKKAGFCKVFGYGNNPAVLVIDVEYGFVGAIPNESIINAIKVFPFACGPNGWHGISEIKKLLKETRRHKIPVIYFHTQRKPNAKPKHNGLYGDEIVAEIKPRKNDIVIAKPSFSAFFGTNLLSHLVALKIDTLIVTGCTTSGCIRATVVDAYCYKYKVIVPAACVFDRVVIPHKVNLFDMDAKFADVVELEEVFDYFNNRLTK